MKKIQWILGTIIILCAGLTACKESEESRRERARRELLEKLAKQKRAMQENNQNATEKRKERDAKGDTVALSMKVLEACLPKEYAGYTKNGVPINAPSKMNGHAYATIEQTYTKGAQNIRLTIRDANQGVSDHAGMGKIWKTKPPIKTKKVVAKYVLLAGKFNAWEYYKKKEQRAGLSIDVSDRIYIELLGTAQTDTEALKGLAGKIDLQKLANY